MTDEYEGMKVVMGAIATAMIGIYGWFIFHLSGKGRHPDGNQLVYKDFCDVSTKGLADHITTEIKRVEEVLTTRLDNIHREIRVNGKNKI